MSCTRRAFLFQTFGMAVGTTLADAVPKAAQDRPNILCLVSEDTSANLGCYGNTFARTPNLDALAREGFRFDTCIGMPVCSVSRFALITGCQPATYNAQNHRSKAVLWGEMRPYPILFREHGYHTINTPKTDYNADFPLREMWDSAKGASTDWAQRPNGKPFLAIYNFSISHEYRAHSRKRPRFSPHQVTLPPYQPDLPETRAAMAHYLDALEDMDRAIGKALKTLRESPDAENTIVFYYGDNGGHTFRTKRFLTTSGIRVPMIAWFPPKWRHLAPPGIAPGGVCNELVHFVDIPATLLSLAGIPLPPWMQGRPFAGAWRSKPRRFAFSSRDRMDERYDMSRCVHDGRHLYIRHFRPEIPSVEPIRYAYAAPAYQAVDAAYQAGTLAEPIARLFREKMPEELYDTVTDPDCMRNLAATPTLRPIRNRLAQALRDHMIETEDQGLVTEGVPHRRKVAPLCEAAWAASERNPERIPMFLQGLNAKDADLRRWSAIGLAILGQAASGAEQELEAAWRCERNRAARVEMAFAGIRLTPPERHAPYVESLVDALRENDWMAGNALVRIAPEDLLPHEDALREIARTSRLSHTECDIPAAVLERLSTARPPHASTGSAPNPTRGSR